MEKSFILLKPDAMDNVKIRKQVYDLIGEQLKIVEQRIVFLSEEDIDIIWPYCKHDPVCHWLMKQYIVKRELLLLGVEGKDALNIIKNIKKEVRKTYATSPFQNCVHAPSNELEYHKDINCILYEEKTNLVVCDRTIIGDFVRISEYSLQDMWKCAEKIYERFQITTFANYECERSKIKKQMLYILNDEIHDAKYVASAILDFLPKATLLEAYWIAMGVDYLGKYPLIDLIEYNDLIEVNRVETLFSMVDIKTERAIYESGN